MREKRVDETKTGHKNHKTKKVGEVTPKGKDSEWKIDLSDRPKQRQHRPLYSNLFCTKEKPGGKRG